MTIVNIKSKVNTKVQDIVSSEQKKNRNITQTEYKKDGEERNLEREKQTFGETFRFNLL